jgi:hypothetical protein
MISHMDDLLTSSQVAAILGMTVAGVNTRRRAGTLKAAAKANTTYLFRRSDVLAAPRNQKPRLPPAQDA